MKDYKNNKSIYISKPFLPPIEEYQQMIVGIWERNYLTNDGPLVKDFEKKIKNYLNSPELAFVSNGTVALQLAIKALEIKKQIITTPFSFVATTSSIVWENCTPVFVDIDKDSFNIDPRKIEEAITEDTEAILATHCFGNPCEVEKIQQIADEYNLKVIYDAAHCFGVNYKNKSIFNYGDISTTSFHATKLFHTTEGGGVFSNNNEITEKIKIMRNFGQTSPEEFNVVGINAKNSEFHAAMGLCNLQYVEEIMKKRKEQFDYYNELLQGVPLQRQKITNDTDYNYSYYPIVFESEEVLLKIKAELEKNSIMPRRYFYPSLSNLPHLKEKKETPVADDIARRILCLPIYHKLKKEGQERVVGLIKEIIL